MTSTSCGLNKLTHACFVSDRALVLTALELSRGLKLFQTDIQLEVKHALDMQTAPGQTTALLTQLSHSAAPVFVTAASCHV